MGYSAQRQNVLLYLAALEAVLRREGWKAEAGGACRRPSSTTERAPSLRPR